LPKKNMIKPYTWVGVAGKYFVNLLIPVVPTNMTLDVNCSTKE